MINRFLALTLGLTLGACACAQKVSFLRTFKIGDKDVYSLAMNGDFGKPMTISLTQTQEVTKVFDDGGAELTITEADMKMLMDGKDLAVPAAAQTPIVMRVDKFGRPSNMGVKGGPGSSMQFMYSALSGLQDGIAVGQSVPYEAKNPEMNTDSKGTVKLLDVTNGAANFHVTSDTLIKDKTSHVEGDFSLDSSTAKLLKFAFDITMDGGKVTHVKLIHTAP